MYTYIYLCICWNVSYQTLGIGKKMKKTFIFCMFKFWFPQQAKSISN